MKNNLPFKYRLVFIFSLLFLICFIFSCCSGYRSTSISVDKAEKVTVNLKDSINASSPF